MSLEIVDYHIREEMIRRYEGYDYEEYAKGYGREDGRSYREIFWDVFLKDGSQFIAVGRCDMETGEIRVDEREYVNQ